MVGGKKIVGEDIVVLTVTPRSLGAGGSACERTRLGQVDPERAVVMGVRETKRDENEFALDAQKWLKTHVRVLQYLFDSRVDASRPLHE